VLEANAKATIAKKTKNLIFSEKIKKMKILVVFAIAALAVAASPSNWIYNLINITPPQYLPQIMGSKLALGDVCPNEQVILKANSDWLNYLGIIAPYSWKNATQIWPRIKNMLQTDDVNVLQKVCRSRDLFYRTLGQENYYHCINIYGLMQYTTDWSTAAYYVRMWSHLDFMCNIGYQQFMDKSSWACMTLLDQNQGCNTAYLNNVNWNDVCPALQNYTMCSKQAADRACGPPNGYFACEDIRLGHGANCPNIRCTIN
jgi:hypothetical protein